MLIWGPTFKILDLPESFYKITQTARPKHAFVGTILLDYIIQYTIDQSGCVPVSCIIYVNHYSICNYYALKIE